LFVGRQTTADKVIGPEANNSAEIVFL